MTILFISPNAAYNIYEEVNILLFNNGKTYKAEISMLKDVKQGGIIQLHAKFQSNWSNLF